MASLQEMDLPRAQLGLLKTLLQHAGSDKRVADLFSNRSFSSRFATMAKQSLRVCVFPPLMTGVHDVSTGGHSDQVGNSLAVLQGVENVYTQHTPLLLNTLESLIKGRLKDMDYPTVSKSVSSVTGPIKPPRLVVIFIVGGTTYEEAKAVAELNMQVHSA